MQESVLSIMEDTTYIKSELTGKNVGILFILLGIAGMLVPSFFAWDMMQWGFGTITLSFFVAIMGLVTFLIYYRRYKNLESLFSSGEMLAHWHYSTDKYQEQAKKTFEENKSTYKGIYKTILFFFITFTALFLVFGFSSTDTESMLAFSLMMGGVLSIITVAALISPGIHYRKALKAEPEVIIGKTSMLFLGQLHTWGSTLFQMENVEVDKAKKHITFTLKYLTKIGWYTYETYTVNVPIPTDELEKAEKVVKILLNA